MMIDFRVSKLDDIAVSIRQKSYIKSLLISLLLQIWNHRYSKHLRRLPIVEALNSLFMILTLILCHPLMFLTFLLMCSNVLYYFFESMKFLFFFFLKRKEQGYFVSTSFFL